MRLFQAFDVDEETPVQFLGIYTTKWRPEWGKPQIMFREVDDPVYEAAPNLLVACEALLRQLKYCEDLLDIVKYDATQISPAEEKARIAIIKAKGGSDDDVGDVTASGTESTQ